MPKKLKTDYDLELTDLEPETEPETEPELRISKRTGKPVRPLTEKQKETLAKGRALAVQRRKEMVEGIDLKKRAENIKKAKEELHNAKVAKNKKLYEDALKDDEESEKVIDREQTPLKERPKPEKKIKKKVIKYVEASDSDSEEEEVIIRKKKKEPKKEEDIPQNILKQKLRNNLEEVKQSSLAQLLMPTYY